MVTSIDSNNLNQFSNSAKNEQLANIGEWLSGVDELITEKVVAGNEKVKNFGRDAFLGTIDYLAEDGSFAKTYEAGTKITKNSYNGVKNYIAEVRADDKSTRMIVDGLMAFNNGFNSVAGSVEDTASAIGNGGVDAAKSVASWNGDVNLTKKAGYTFAASAAGGIGMVAMGAMDVIPAGRIVSSGKILLDASKIDAKRVFKDAAIVEKPGSELIVLTNKSNKKLSFNTKLEDSKGFEVEGNSAPSGGKLSVHPKGEIIHQQSFDMIYYKNRSVTGSESDKALVEHAKDSMKRAGIDPNLVDISIATNIPRKDKIVRLQPIYDGDNKKIDTEYSFLQPGWGKDDKGKIQIQDGKDGDFLVENGADGSIYINNRKSGTADQLVISGTNKPVLENLDSIKSVQPELLIGGRGNTF